MTDLPMCEHPGGILAHSVHCSYFQVRITEYIQLYFKEDQAL